MKSKINWVTPGYLLLTVLVVSIIISLDFIPVRSFTIPATVSPAFARTTLSRSTGNKTTSTNQTSVAANDESVAITPDDTFTLRTGIKEGHLVFIGVGKTIDGLVDPTLHVKVGDVVQITLINGEGAQHDIAFPDFNAKSDYVTGKGASSVVVFRADKEGEFPYYCTVPGHRQAGMEGKLIVGAGRAKAVRPEAVDISRDPTNLSPPISKRPPKHVTVNLEAVELNGNLADGTTYKFWTFNGKVPGPFIRVKKGDTVELHLKNRADSRMIHSIDLHAVNGPGGGSSVMQVPPGKEKVFTFKALKSGLFVYHCATPMVAHHISNGMYGLILVEPEEGLPPVDKEFYVMQGEVYTVNPYGQHGPQQFSVEKLLNEIPEYVVFNGAVGALSNDHPLKAKVGDTVRIFFGNGGPNYTSSFHVIGEQFDFAYENGSLMTPPQKGIQTMTVPPGDAGIFDIHLDAPGKYLLVDHALSRMERGLVGFLEVEGPKNPSIFKEGE